MWDSTSFSTDSFSTVSWDFGDVERSSRRVGIRPVQEGFGTAKPVWGWGEVGRPHAHGEIREGTPGGAYARGVESTAEVGLPGIGVGGHATHKNLRPVRGSVGTPIPHAGGSFRAAGFESASECGTAAAHGAGVARGRAGASAGYVSTPRGAGIINPTNEEIIAMIAAVRRRRKKD